jgi:hypothetical protein
LSYEVLLDGVVASAINTSSAHVFNAPSTVGSHTLTGRIYNSLGGLTEVTETFTVDSSVAGWRTFYFGAPDNTGNAADAMDADGDGLSNAFECVAGLSPIDAASRFAPEVKSVFGYPDRMAIVFGPVVGGRTYKVKYKDAMGDTQWQELFYSTTIFNGAERIVTDLSAGVGPRFYRVEITVP